MKVEGAPHDDDACTGDEEDCDCPCATCRYIVAGLPPTHETGVSRS